MLASAELIAGIVTIAWMAALVWSLYVILTTRRDTWASSGMSQLMWLAFVVFMPILGSLLFAVVGRRQLGNSKQSPQSPSEATLR
jgi:threonine/homoserine efflux transporter RhtA